MKIGRVEGSGVAESIQSHQEKACRLGEEIWENGKLDIAPQFVNFSTVNGGKQVTTKLEILSF